MSRIALVLIAVVIAGCISTRVATPGKTSDVDDLEESQLAYVHTQNPEDRGLAWYGDPYTMSKVDGVVPSLSARTSYTIALVPGDHEFEYFNRNIFAPDDHFVVRLTLSPGHIYIPHPRNGGLYIMEHPLTWFLGVPRGSGDGVIVAWGRRYIS